MAYTHTAPPCCALNSFHAVNLDVISVHCEHQIEVGASQLRASEDEAITAAETVLTQYFVTRGEVNAAGGTDTAPLEAWATGRALEVAVNDAAGIAEGPILNVDQVNVEGPATTEGAIKYETVASYGQEWEGIENGLVTINACQDASEYKVWASDGSEAMRPEARSTFDYQVVYDSESETWLVYNLISLGESC